MGCANSKAMEVQRRLEGGDIPLSPSKSKGFAYKLDDERHTVALTSSTLRRYSPVDAPGSNGGTPRTGDGWDAKTTAAINSGRFTDITKFSDEAFEQALAKIKEIDAGLHKSPLSVPGRHGRAAELQDEGDGGEADWQEPELIDVSELMLGLEDEDVDRRGSLTPGSLTPTGHRRGVAIDSRSALFGGDKAYSPRSSGAGLEAIAASPNRRRSSLDRTSPRSSPHSRVYPFSGPLPQARREPEWEGAAESAAEAEPRAPAEAGKGGSDKQLSPTSVVTGQASSQETGDNWTGQMQAQLALGGEADAVAVEAQPADGAMTPDALFDPELLATFEQAFQQLSEEDWHIVRSDDDEESGAQGGRSRRRSQVSRAEATDALLSSSTPSLSLPPRSTSSPALAPSAPIQTESPRGSLGGAHSRVASLTAWAGDRAEAEGESGRGLSGSPTKERQPSMDAGRPPQGPRRKASMEHFESQDSMSSMSRFRHMRRASSIDSSSGDWSKFYHKEQAPRKQAPVTGILAAYPERMPPSGENKVVFYSTTMRAVRKTFDQCTAVRALLTAYNVELDERDISMHVEFREELRSLLGKMAAVPRVFVMGRYMGGGDEVVTLNEEGRLEVILEDVPRRKDRRACSGCGGVRFVPCPECSGSCKILVDDEVERCPCCNENGLIRCPICC